MARITRPLTNNEILKAKPHEKDFTLHDGDDLFLLVKTVSITFDPEIEMFRGEFVGLNGGADFYAYSVEDLKKEGSESLRIFLDECRKDGIEPYKSFSGKVTTRLTPERHQALTVAAQATGLSINEMLNEGVDLVIQKHS